MLVCQKLGIITLYLNGGNYYEIQRDYIRNQISKTL